jgi:hypothetical protein
MTIPLFAWRKAFWLGVDNVHAIGSDLSARQPFRDAQ